MTAGDSKFFTFFVLKSGVLYPSVQKVDGTGIPRYATGRVDGRAFPLAELTSRQHGPC